jgi:glycosyltransferase involved in cell wall biosynthesis
LPNVVAAQPAGVNAAVRGKRKVKSVLTVATLSQIYCEVVPPEQSSLGIWTWEVARRLSGRCRPVVYARGGRGKPARLAIDGIEVEHVPAIRVGVWRRSARLWRHVFPATQPLVAQPFYALDYVRGAIAGMRGISPDVVHVQNFPSHVPLVRRALPNAAIILHMHCDWLSELDHRLMAKGVSQADLVVGCSRHVVERARTRFGDRGVAFEVVPNGAPVDRSPVKAREGDTLRVLFVGRLSPEKGLHTLIEAWPHVIAAHPGARLDIVGAPAVTDRDLLVDLSADPEVKALARFYPGGDRYVGCYRTALQAMVPDQLRHTVNFVDALPYCDVQERYREAALLVNPSLSESFGMSLVEALAAGTPVVATRVGGMVEIVDDTGGGVLVKKNDPPALAGAICNLLADKILRSELGKRGAQRTARLYGWDTIAERMYELYGIARERRLAASADPREAHIGRQPTSPHSRGQRQAEEAESPGR